MAKYTLGEERQGAKLKPQKDQQNRTFKKPFVATDSCPDSTYVKVYGIHKDLVSQANLATSSWLFTGDNLTRLGGAWQNPALFAVQKNFFIAHSVDGFKLPYARELKRLLELGRDTISTQHSLDYSHNIALFASNRSSVHCSSVHRSPVHRNAPSLNTAWEYPILTRAQASEINDDLNLFSYAALLRYAFASRLAYGLTAADAGLPNKIGDTKALNRTVSSRKAPSKKKYDDDALFKQLMLHNGKLQVVAKTTGEHGVYALALKVPAIADYRLEEEVIIAFKGTKLSNADSLVQDGRLMAANIKELDENWQRAAFAFTEEVIRRFPPNGQSVASGYLVSNSAKKYNVVLTGHSLGAYAAIDSAARTGITSRVFSLPSFEIVGQYARCVAHTLRRRNVINFRMEQDPLTISSDTHDQNLVCFPAVNLNSVDNPIDNHDLDNMIELRLIPLLDNWRDKQARPRYVYITPDSNLGAGLKYRVNHWGHVAW